MKGDITSNTITVRQKDGKAVDGIKTTAAGKALSIDATWGFAHLFNSAPTTSTYVADAGGADDEIHLVVVDSTGKLNSSGLQGYPLEVYANMSGASDSRKPEGGSNYYKDVLDEIKKESIEAARYAKSANTMTFQLQSLINEK